MDNLCAALILMLFLFAVPRFIWLMSVVEQEGARLEKEGDEQRMEEFLNTPVWPLFFWAHLWTRKQLFGGKGE